MGDENLELNREVAELKAMMNITLQTLRDIQSDMKTSYVSKAEFMALDVRVGKVENNPWKFASLIVAAIAAVLAYYK